MYRCHHISSWLDACTIWQHVHSQTSLPGLVAIATVVTSSFCIDSDSETEFGQETMPTQTGSAPQSPIKSSTKFKVPTRDRASMRLNFLRYKSIKPPLRTVHECFCSQQSLLAIAYVAADCHDARHAYDGPTASLQYIPNHAVTVDVANQLQLISAVSGRTLRASSIKLSKILYTDWLCIALSWLLESQSASHLSPTWLTPTARTDYLLYAPGLLSGSTCPPCLLLPCTFLVSEACFCRTRYHRV